MYLRIRYVSYGYCKCVAICQVMSCLPSCQNVSGGSCSVQVVYDDTGHAPLVNPKQVQDVLVKCFIHEVRFVVWLHARVLLE